MSLARKRQPSDFNMDDLLSMSALQEEMGKRNRSSSYRYEYASSSLKRAFRSLSGGSFSFAKLGRKLFAKSVDKAVEAKNRTVDIANEVFFEDANVPEKPLGKALYFTEGSLRGQSFGNLFLTALNGISPSFDQAVSRMSQVLAITGTVLPVTTSDVRLEAEFENGARVDVYKRQGSR